MTSINVVMRPIEWLLLVVLAVLWGGSFFFAKVALDEIGPLTLVLGRVALAAAGLWLVIYARGLPRPRGRGVWRDLFIMGALNNALPFSLIFWAQTTIASGLASILNATTPVFTVVLAHYLTQDERMTANRLAGVVLGFVGVAVLIGPDAIAGLGGDVAAQLACIAGAICYACAGIFGRRFKALPAMLTAAGQLTASSILVLPVALAVELPWTMAMPGAATWGALSALALVSTAAAYVIYFRILAAAGATNILLVTLLVPVSALWLGTAILGERLDWRHFVGMALIGLGLAAIDGRPLRRFQRSGAKSSAK